ncbi:MAG: SCP2 domain-containing protein [Gammaproteobacteria bacterium]|nr:MAG: SCP2 domain-containing protein [Gammaproteobacteria bacterium]
MKPQSIKSVPRLPRLLAAPFVHLPNQVHSRLLALALTRALGESLHEGELDFLQDRSLSIKVCDAGIDFRLTLADRRLAAASPAGKCDLVIEGTVYDFLQLIGRQVDPDTLVFQRRLVMQGNTELGLQVKNFLDGLETDSLALYKHLEPVLLKILPVYKKFFS